MSCLYCNNTGRYVLPYKGDIGEPCTRCPAGDLAKIREAWFECVQGHGRTRTVNDFMHACGDVFGWEQEDKT